MRYEFELTFRLPPCARNVDQLVELLYEAGCDDALIGTGLPGHVALQFDREADSLQQAINSALKDVKTTIPDAELIEATPASMS